MSEREHMMSDDQSDPVTLSPEGELRRRRMLDDLHAAMDRRRAARRRRRWAAGGISVAAVAVIVAGVAMRLPTAGSGGALGASGSVAATGGSVRVEGVATDPSIAERLARGAVRSPRVTILSDDELVALASAQGVGRGLIRTGSGARLVRLDEEGATASPP